jgi:hypothetical protein
MIERFHPPSPQDAALTLNKSPLGTVTCAETQAEALEVDMENGVYSVKARQIASVVFGPFGLVRSYHLEAHINTMKVQMNTTTERLRFHGLWVLM